MRCLCPLEDRECPGNCSPKERAKRRGARAEQLYKQGFTEEQIATELGVNVATISRDLQEFLHDAKTQPRTSKRGRKGEGRPKGRKSTRGKETPKLDKAREIVREQLEADKPISPHKLQDKHGISHVTFDMAITAELARKEARQTILEDQAIDTGLSPKSKITLADAIRIHKSRLDKQFTQRVSEEVRRQIDAANDATRANNKKLHLENINLQRIVGQHGVFTETQYKQMLLLCHPDSSASPQLKAELLQILIENKVKLIKSAAKKAA